MGKQRKQKTTSGTMSTWFRLLPETVKKYDEIREKFPELNGWEIIGEAIELFLEHKPEKIGLKELKW